MSTFGFGAAAFVAAGISGVNLLVGFFVLKNPISNNSSTEMKKTPETIFQTGKEIYINYYYIKNFPRMFLFYISNFLMIFVVTQVKLLLLFLSSFSIMFAFTGFEITLGFLLAKQHNLPQIYLGIILSIFGVIMAIVQGNVVTMVTILTKM